MIESAQADMFSVHVRTHGWQTLISIFNICQFIDMTFIPSKSAAWSLLVLSLLVRLSTKKSTLNPLLQDILIALSEELSFGIGTQFLA